MQSESGGPTVTGQQLNSGALDNGVLNALSAHIAVLDGEGKIVAVNEAWSRFAADNGRPREEAVGVGANYVVACRRAADSGDQIAGAALEGIEAVLSGRRETFRIEYPCHAPDEFRWFLLNVTPLQGREGVVVAHEDMTARKLAEMALHDSHAKLERRVSERTAELEESNRMLQKEMVQRRLAEVELRQAATVFESANEAIIIADDACRILAVNRAFARISGYDADEVRGMDFSLHWSEPHRTGLSHGISTALKEQGQWQGETWKRRKNGDLYPALESISRVRDDKGRTVTYVSTFSDISAIKDAEARLYDLAHHDVLTGLANRLNFSTQLDAAIERAHRHEQHIAVLFMDLDRFKLVNDTLGHTTGDTLLQSVAKRLRAVVRGEDIVARWGGDEFVVIAEGLSQPEDAAHLAEKINGSLAQSVRIGAHDVAAPVSIGVSVYPDDATDGIELVRMADSAMYHAKETGRNGYQFYRTELTDRAYEYLALQSELRQAVEQQDFSLQYQPQVSLQTGQIEGFEALLRWRHPQKGMLLPEDFLRVAEETDLIQPIGEWVLRTACNQIKAWHDEGLSPGRVAVNLSVKELQHGDLSRRVAGIVEQCGLEPTGPSLDLEITENLQQVGEHVADALQGLRDIGLSLSIDDFGTGYSSLSQLRRLPIDRLKIDKSFIADVPGSPDGCAVVQAILALGRSLRLRVVAEGVENEQQLEFLRDNGCDLAQGYFVSRPVDAEAAGALLS